MHTSGPVKSMRRLTPLLFVRDTRSRPVFIGTMRLLLVFVLLGGLGIFNCDGHHHHRHHSRRLPKDVIPELYEITWIPTLDCKFSGKVTIYVVSKNETDSITLNSKYLDVDSTSFTLEEVGNEKKTSQEIQQPANESSASPSTDRLVRQVMLVKAAGRKLNASLTTVKDLIRIKVEEPLKASGRYKLYMAFNGTMNSKNTTGIVCQKYQVANETKWASFLSLEPDKARTAFPCWDEPFFKANYTISIARNNTDKALSNMPVKNSSPFSEIDGWTLDTFETTPKMSTYLLNFLVSNYYQSLDSQLSNGYPLRIWGRPHVIDYGDFALRVAARHYSFLQNYTGIDNPLPKQDFLSIRNFRGGGLENWGLIDLNEPLVLFNPRHRRNKEIVRLSSNLMGHELAHIWFGNLVTPEWWDDIWLSEGFADYLGQLSTSKIHSEADYHIEFGVATKQEAMLADSRLKSHPLKLDVDHVHGLINIFDTITYKKGASIIRMLNLTVGEDNLRDGLRCYLKRRLYSSASEQDLWDCLDGAAHEVGNLPKDISLATAMHSWVNRAGYPVVTVKRDNETGMITITQRSIHDRENEDVPTRDEAAKQGWWIPLTYIYKDENETTIRPRLWLDPRLNETIIPDPAPQDSWILFNLFGAGYYRVQYDEDNAVLLLTDSSPQMGMENKAFVVMDMASLAVYGFTPVVNSFEVFNQVKTENSPILWLAVLDSAELALSMLRGTEIEGAFTSFLNKILVIGMETVNVDAPHKKQLVKLACKVGVEKCKNLTGDLFTKWSQNSENEIPDDVRETVYCDSASKGDPQTWQLLFSRYKSSKDENEKEDLLRGMACTKNTKSLQNYLNMAFDPKIKTTPLLFTMLEDLGKNHPDFFLDALIAKKSMFRKKKKILYRLTENIATELNSEQQLEKLKTLLNVDSLVYKSELKNGLAMRLVEGNIQWVKQNKDDIKGWLNQNQ